MQKPKCLQVPLYTSWEQDLWETDPTGVWCCGVFIPDGVWRGTKIFLHWDVCNRKTFCFENNFVKFVLFLFVYLFLIWTDDWVHLRMFMVGQTWKKGNGIKDVNIWNKQIIMNFKTVNRWSVRTANEQPPFNPHGEGALRVPSYA